MSINRSVRDNRRATIVESLEPLILMSASSSDNCSSFAMGTEGHDVLLALQPGEAVDGLGGNDLIFGLGGSNQLNGGDGNDVFFTPDGQNTIDGGAGDDTVHFWGIKRSDATIARTSDGQLEVITANSSTVVRNAETLRFRDQTTEVNSLVADDEYRSIDGSGNNLQTPDVGTVETRLIRIADSEYADGIAEPGGENRLSARSVSNEISAQQTTERNDRGLTDITWLWGQFLDHDISISENAVPAEPFNVQVPAGDALFDPTFTGGVQIAFDRTVADPNTGDSESNPREQINQITTFIDGSMIYGSDDDRLTELRSYESGQLRTSAGDLLPNNGVELPNQDGDLAPADQFLAGDVRANENVALTAMHTLWVREHNRIAESMALANSSLTDEQIFQQARAIVIAEIQAISYNEFLPALLGQHIVGEYQGYDETVDPSVTNEFSTAAYRFGHTMLSSELLRLNNDRTEIEAGSLAMLEAFFAPEEIRQHGIDSVLLGATQQTANEVDTMIIDDVRNFLFGPPSADGLDLATLNIQRGRDHGLADYNDVRVALGLEAVQDFADITSDADLQQRLAEVYGNVNDIDLWIGGLAEDHVNGGSLGETFTAIIVDQFNRLRDGDRFWYENVFRGEQLALIESTTLADVIERNTTITELQEDIFFAPTA